jgi:DNA-binding PadR family transcriptional regulator
MLSDLAFHVLLALGEGPSHGYAIGKAVEEQSGGRLDPTTGALYQVLRRLSEDGLIAEVDAPKDVDPRRRYFTLSPQGRNAAAAEAARLDALVRTARKRRLFPQRA